MWLARQLEALRAADGPLLIVGGEPYGVAYVIDALRAHDRVAWAQLPPRLDHDPVGQGNAFATSINAALGAPGFSHALPLRAHVAALERHARDLVPLWLVVSAVELEPRVVQEVERLGASGYRVVFDVERAPAPFADGASGVGAGDGRIGRAVIGPEQLRVRPDEARALLPGALDAAEIDALVAETDGRFTELLSRGLARAGLPPLHVPSPRGPLAAPTDAELVEPNLLVQALQRDGRPIEALELAALRAPELIDDVLRAAGPAYQEHGLLQRLHLVLSAVPRPYAISERALEWRLVAALAADDLGAVATEVDAYLAAHAAPELRARRAGSLPAQAGFALAEAAVAAKRTPLTLWQYGRQHPDPDTAIALLKESVELAEDVGTPYDQVRNAGALAARLGRAGAFQRAAAWAAWALQVYDHHRLHDGTRRLMLVNDLAYARLMCGDVVGLRRTLEDAWSAIDGAVPRLAGFFRTTMAYLELALGRPEAALELLRDAYERSPRRGRTRYAHQYVRVLNDLGLTAEAFTVARDGLELSGTEVAQRRRSGLLARGMVRAVAGVEGATDDLLEVLAATDAPADERIAAALHYLLASDGAAHHLPDDVARLLTTVHPTALRLLSGPAHLMQRVWDTIEGGGEELRLELFGAPSCRVEGRRVRLPPRLAEVALALALHPSGVDAHGLNAFLTRDGTRPFTPGGMRGLLTRVRTVLPVSESPYRFTVPFTADVVEVRTRLASGQVREAIALLRGPLLPGSQAPGVEELRAMLEEELRQAALHGGDAEALYDLADRLSDDLEVWEATAANLPANDPRQALVRARMRRLAREYA